MAEDDVPRITEQVFQHLVELAQLDLDQAQAEYLRAQLNAQLDVIRQLDEIEVGDDIPASSHGVPYSPLDRGPERADQVQPSNLADEILENAPETEGRYIVVPDIPHEEL